MAHLATSSYSLTFRETPVGILVISIGTRVRSYINRFCLAPPYIAPQLAIQNDVRENHIAHGSLITVLNTETTVATFDYTIIDNHIIDGIHILAANLHGTAATLHHTIRYHDVVTGTIFFELTAVFQADGIIATGDMTVGNAHILAMIDINAITITDLEVVEQIDTINHSPITSDEMHSPVSTFPNGNITDIEIPDSHQGKHVRTGIESSDRFEFVTIKKFSTHKPDTIAMNRTMTRERKILHILRPYPHHTLTLVLTEGTEMIDTLIGIGFPDGIGFQNDVHIRLQLYRS